jgi:hypothetical protein
MPVSPPPGDCPSVTPPSGDSEVIRRPDEQRLARAGDTVDDPGAATRGTAGSEEPAVAGYEIQHAPSAGRRDAAERRIKVGSGFSELNRRWGRRSWRRFGWTGLGRQGPR